MLSIGLFANLRRFRVLVMTIVILSGLGILVFKLGLVVGIFGLPGAYVKEGPGKDFLMYYAGVKNWLEGKNMYDGTGFVYPPIAIFIFLPLIFFSLNEAWLINILFNILCLFILTALCIKIVEKAGIHLVKAQKFLIYIFSFLFYPVFTNFIVGQINILIALIVTLVYYLLFVKKTKGRVAGILLAIGTVLKVWPMALLLLAFFLPSRKAKKFILHFALSLLFIFVISFLIFGVQEHIIFLNTLKELNMNRVTVKSPDDILNVKTSLSRNKSIFYFLNKVYTLIGIKNVFFLNISLKIAMGCLGGFILYKLRKRLNLKSKKVSSMFPYGLYEARNNSSLGIVPFFCIILFTILLSDVVWVHYGVYMLLPFLFFVFVFNLDFIEKVIITLSFSLLALQIYVVYLADIVGGVFQIGVQILNPATAGFLLLAVFLVYTTLRNSAISEVLFQKNIKR